VPDTAAERLAHFRARICATTALRRVSLAHQHDQDTEDDIKSHKSALALLALALLSGKITKAQYIEKVTALLHSGMVTAAERGGADTAQASALADGILKSQTKRIDGLAHDLDESTLGDGDEAGTGLSAAQAALYAGGLAGMLWGAHQGAKTADAGDDREDGSDEPGAKAAQWDWVLDPETTNHCDDCESNADGGPYSKDDLPGYPGDGSTICAGNCRCRLEEA